MQTEQILSTAAVITSGIGALFSIITFYLKRKADKVFAEVFALELQNDRLKNILNKLEGGDIVSEEQVFYQLEKKADKLLTISDGYKCANKIPDEKIRKTILDTLKETSASGQNFSPLISGNG